MIKRYLHSILILVTIFNQCLTEDIDKNRDLQEQCFRGNDIGARGEYKNVVTMISIPSKDANLVDIEFIYDISIFSGNIREIDLPVFNSDFGNVRLDNVSAEISIEDEEDLYFEVKLKESSSGSTVDAEFCFGKLVSSSISLTVRFQVEDLICTRNGESVISAVWFSQLTGVNTKNVEIDYKYVFY